MNAWIDLLHRSPLPRAAFLLQNAYLLLRKPRTLGVRTLALDPSGAVLLVRHSYRPGWFLPGGGVHKWETLEQAAIRESREEGAIDIEKMEPLFGMYANFTPYRCDHVALFVTRRWRRIDSRSAEIAETANQGRTRNKTRLAGLGIITLPRSVSRRDAFGETAGDD